MQSFNLRQTEPFTSPTNRPPLQGVRKAPVRAFTRGILHLLAAYFAVTACAALSAETSPDALVKTTVEEVLMVIKQNKDKRALRSVAEQKILPNFDFKRMTELAMGRSWRDASPPQQQALEASFRTLLVNTYTSALSMSASGNETVDVRPVQAGGQNDVTVKTTVKDGSKQPVAVDYRLSKSGEGWKVYDVVVENLSIVTNYRGTFSSEVARSGIDGLIKVLEEKNRVQAKS